MAFHKGQCKYEGCQRMQTSLGRRKNDHKEKKTYYSTYCAFHQKAYNRVPVRAPSRVIEY